MNPPDIEAALKYQKLMNAWPNRWARFEAQQFEHARLVTVTVGYILSDGSKERLIETSIFGINYYGEVEHHKHAHI